MNTKSTHPNLDNVPHSPHWETAQEQVLRAEKQLIVKRSELDAVRDRVSILQAMPDEYGGNKSAELHKCADKMRHLRVEVLELEQFLADKKHELSNGRPG